MHKLELLLPSTLLALVVCGCASGSTMSPPIGSTCSVHFRRDSLGVASESPIPISTGTHNGAEIILSGEIVKMDDEWLVLKVAGKTETWVPQNVILHMTVISPGDDEGRSDDSGTSVSLPDPEMRPVGSPQ
jgi:hypothetical protein